MQSSRISVWFAKAIYSILYMVVSIKRIESIDFANHTDILDDWIWSRNPYYRPYETMALLGRQSPIPSNGFYIMTKILLKKMATGDDLRILPDVQTKCIDSRVSKSNMHSPPTRKLGKWWQMWYDDFGFYRFTTFMVCLKFRPICFSPEFSLASDQKLRWRLLTILIIHAACMVYSVLPTPKNLTIDV
jgi:hypothetical protein